MINCLNSADSVGIIAFNNQVKKFEQQMVLATDENKQNLIYFLGNLTPSKPESNYTLAFEKAFEMMSLTFQN